jgi:peptidoglycan/xylan/chitin deacetylase (PgdA/CDA1 family)
MNNMQLSKKLFLTLEIMPEESSFLGYLRSSKFQMYSRNVLAIVATSLVIVMNVTVVPAAFAQEHLARSKVITSSNTILPPIGNVVDSDVRRHHNHHHDGNDSDRGGGHNNDGDSGGSSSIHNSDDRQDEHDGNDENDGNPDNRNIIINNNNINSNNDDNGNRCNCVIVRLDDVQDDWVRNVQLDLLDLLISERIPTSTAIIVNEFGNDPQIVSMVKEGRDAGLFEYAIHGWDHVDYATLSLEEQQSTLMKAKDKLTRVLGEDSDIFVTPYNNFSDDTLTAMSRVGMTVISSDDTDHYPYFPKESPVYPNIAHMPQSINFGDEGTGRRLVRALPDVIAGINKDVQGRGYAVFTLHPQDFTQYDQNGKIKNEVNEAAMDELKEVIDTIRDEGYSFASYHEVLEKNHPDLTTIPDMSDPYVKIVTPSPHSSFSAGSQVTVSGIAFDDSKIGIVEVRLGDGDYMRTSTSNNFRNWTIAVPLPSSAGVTDIVAKAVDISGKETWVSVSVDVR